MIDLLITNNVKSGVLTFKNNAINVEGVTNGSIRIRKLGFERSLNASTTPTLANFLNPSLSSIITVPSKVDDILDVEYILLVPLLNTSYKNGSNVVEKQGIFNEVQKVSHLYSNGKVYEIDKDASTTNRIYLTTHLEDSTAEIFLAHYKIECVTSLYGIPKMLKALIFSQGDCSCKNCGESLNKITDSLRYIEALSLTTELDCDEKRAFMKCLKELFDLC